MKFSIVTLAFKQERYIREAIDSVLNQDYPEIEYIVVEPGSNDGSRDVIDGYGSRIAHRIYEPDRGAADGLNKGFAQATGDVFAFLNADDFLLPHALRYVAEFFERNPDCDLVLGNGLISDHAGKPLRHVKTTPFTPARYLYGGTSWLQQATFFRRRAFDLVGGFNIENRSSWDGELFVNMVARGATVGYLARELGAFRLHDASITGSGTTNHIYKADSDRLFQEIQGRRRNRMDALVNFYYRAERILRHPGQISTTLLSHLRAWKKDKGSHPAS